MKTRLAGGGIHRIEDDGSVTVVKLKRTSLEVPVDLWFRWKMQAAREGVSMRDLFIRELTRYLDRKEAKR